MTVASYIALSGQMALERRMVTIANNMANINTVGFKSDAVRFEAVLKGQGDNQVDYVSEGDIFIDRAEGGLNPTGNELDVAITGNAWLGVQTPNGLVYTRDGRFKLDAAGGLVTLLGHPVVDAGGQRIEIDPAGGPPTIGSQGQILQAGQRTGSIGLFQLPADAVLTRSENSAVVSDQPGQPVTDFAGISVHQGFVETSNVSPVLEMTRLIMVQRAFEAAASALETAESTQGRVVRELGATS